MSGVPGAGGPPPKRADQRLGHRSKADKGSVETAPAAESVEIPPAKDDWHPIARDWYESLAKSGQSQFYEPADWMSAYVCAESMSRELKPQPMVVGSGKDAYIELHELPPKSASLAAWSKIFTALLATEGDRRRARLELVRQQPSESEGENNVSEFELYRQRLNKSS